MVSWPVLALRAVENHGDSAIGGLLRVPVMLWLLLAAESIYGLYLAWRREAGEFGRVPRGRHRHEPAVPARRHLSLADRAAGR